MESVRVLHAEDDPGVADLTATWLERENPTFEVTSVSDAEAALDEVADGGFDCLVSDYDMPGMNGLDLLREVREDHPDLPFVLFTGKGSEEIASEAISAGVTDYLRKGGTERYEVLANRIENYVEKRRAERRVDRIYEALDTAEEGISLLDSEGEFIYLNDAYADILGYDPDELLGRHWETIYPEETDFDIVREQYLPEAEAGGWSGKTVYERKDGDRVLTNHSLAYAEDGTLICVARDISEERERGPERRFEPASGPLDAVNDVFYVIDTDGHLRWWNDRLTDVTGYDADELDSVHISELIVPEDHAAVFDAVEDAIETGQAKVAARVRTADGEEHPFEFTGARVDVEDAPDRICGVGRDVSDRRELRAKLAKSEASLARLYEVSSRMDLSFEEKLDALLQLGCERLDLPYGFLTNIDETTQRIVQSVGDHPELQAGNACPLSESYCRKTLDSEGLLGVLDATEEGWQEDPAYERFGLGSYLGGKVVVEGEVYGTLCFASDESHDPFTDSERTFVELLTRWIGYELEQRESKARLERQNERLEEFASVLSHDIRTPMNVVRGRIDLARETEDVSHLDDADTALDRMERLVTDLLVLAREGEVIDEVGPVSLAEAARETWETTPAGEAQLVAEDATVEADAGRLQQLLANLFQNALDHGGRDVTVRVGALDSGGFYVEDTGEGIPPERREAVLERGVSDGDGTGLGLAIVRTIADAHGWDVAVTESAEGGARFEFSGADSDARAAGSPTADASNVQ